jgi:hypothetical protein
LRFLVLGESIVSDRENPVATSARAILSALAKLGHEVTFLERRGNAAWTGLLRQRGAEPLRAFDRRYPAIRHRTYDLPRGWERTVWFGREAGTCDAIIALPGAPPELIPEIAAMPERKIARFIDHSFAIEHTGFRLVRSTVSDDPTAIDFGPAVEPGVAGKGRCPEPLIVAYDNHEAAEALAVRMQTSSPRLVVTGSAHLPNWRFLPEVELPDLYRQYKLVLVVGVGSSEWSPARALLARAQGCILLDAEGSDLFPEHQPVPVQSLASTQAHALVAATRSVLRPPS